MLILVSLTGILVLAFLGPMPQDPRYHDFADSQAMLGIPHFWNVISNVPFLLVGLIGLARYPRLTHSHSKTGYVLLCTAVFLVGVGSAYYHLAPNNVTLLWDRLPMTVAFMALLSLLVNERVIADRNLIVLWLLVLVGVGAALYWSWTESLGRGDLRPYVLVQFLPVVLMPLILLLYPARYLRSALLLSAFGLYFIAKALEHFDNQILSLTASVGGHPIKHVVAAAAVLCIVYAVPAVRSRRSP